MLLRLLLADVEVEEVLCEELLSCTTPIGLV